MPWRLVRLEHGPSSDFPNGSAVRGYLLRIPLKANGHIDGEIHSLDPNGSTVRRFWPSEKILSGNLRQNGSRWEMVSSDIQSARSMIAWFLDQALITGTTVQVFDTELDASPFVVVNIRAD